MTASRIEIHPRKHLNAVVTVPGSKSCTARALAMAALTPGISTLTGAAQGDDAGYMVEGLRALGAGVTREDDTVTVTVRRLAPPRTPLYLGNSGTAMRFLAAGCAGIPGTTVLDGTPRMRQRPIGDLAAALSEWGVSVATADGYPPVSITSQGPFGGTTHIQGGASSQYLSGLLMTAPQAAREAIILVEGELVSKPYVDLTVAMMAERGVEAENQQYRAFRVATGNAMPPETTPSKQTPRARRTSRRRPSRAGVYGCATWPRRPFKATPGFRGSWNAWGAACRRDRLIEVEGTDRLEVWMSI